MSTRWIVPGDGSAGWEHGLPPAITPASWPRHAKSGLPLVHGFTIRVPEELRVRGADRVALSYFHPGDSESFGPKREHAARIQAVMAGGALEGSEVDDAFFRAMAEHMQAETPHMQRFTDLLGHTHAIVWHTEADLHAPRCERPSALPEGQLGKAMYMNEPVREKRGLAMTDVAPERVMIQLGGPLHWIQADIEEFGDKVIEVEDDVGRANYGGGNCQIDLENGLLDWACG